ncbi:MAG: hypothetical protein M1840_007730 [Geoglossum simile]|nr:MAG: hypothetical protein M1840_007730 [Geoglossum simile]
MLRSQSLCYIAGALLSFFLPNTAAQILSPIRNDPSSYEVRAALDRRAETNLLDLQNVETFLWGGVDNSTAALGNLTVYTPAEYEHIINMEKFYPLLTSLTCDTEGMTIAFKDDTTFEKAKEAWDWANGADNRSFIMVTGMGDCGWNRQRQPYVVRNLQYDEVKNIARLVGEPKDWEEIAQSYDLVVGHIPGNEAWLTKKDLSKTLSIPLDLSFPFSLELGAEGIKSKLECSECGLNGHFNIELRISTWLGIPKGASIKMSPSSVKAIAKLEWSLSGELTKDFEKEWKPATFPTPASIVIPHVVEIGPVIDLIVGVALKALNAQATVTGGAIASLPDSAIVELNLLNPTENKFSGWLPAVQPLPFEVDARISAGVETYFATALQLKAEALGHGFEIGLKLKLPSFTGNFEYIVSETGVCDSKKTMGVKASLNVGGALSIEAKEVSSADKLLDIGLGVQARNSQSWIRAGRSAQILVSQRAQLAALPNLQPRRQVLRALPAPQALPVAQERVLSTVGRVVNASPPPIALTLGVNQKPDTAQVPQISNAALNPQILHPPLPPAETARLIVARPEHVSRQPHAQPREASQKRDIAQALRISNAASPTLQQLPPPPQPAKSTAALREHASPHPPAPRKAANPSPVTAPAPPTSNAATRPPPPPPSPPPPPPPHRPAKSTAAPREHASPHPPAPRKAANPSLATAPAPPTSNAAPQPPAQPPGASPDHASPRAPVQHRAGKARRDFALVAQISRFVAPYHTNPPFPAL